MESDGKSDGNVYNLKDGIDIKTGLRMENIGFSGREIMVGRL